MTAVRLLQVIVLAIAGSATAMAASAGDTAPSPCHNLKAVDFANMKLDLPGWGTVKLSKGIGYTSEDPDFSESKDWKITIEQDEILRPPPSTTLRLLRVTCNHLTGSGAWDHVLIYCCREGKLVRIFQERFHYGVKIQKPEPSELLFEYGEWTKDDPHCCPSLERVSIYRWNESAQTYNLVKSSVHPSKRD